MSDTEELKKVVNVQLRKQLHEYNPEYEKWVDNLCDDILDRIDVFGELQRTGVSKLHIHRQKDGAFLVNVSSPDNNGAWHVGQGEGADPMDQFIKLMASYKSP